MYKTNVVVKIDLFTYLMISFMKESYEFSCINDNILYRKKVNTVTFLKHTVRVMVFNVTFNNISVIS